MVEEYDTGEQVDPEYFSNIDLSKIEDDLFGHLRNIVFKEQYINDYLAEEREIRG